MKTETKTIKPPPTVPHCQQDKHCKYCTVECDDMRITSWRKNLVRTFLSAVEPSSAVLACFQECLVEYAIISMNSGDFKLHCASFCKEVRAIMWPVSYGNLVI